MSKYDDVAGKAAEKTDQELADAITELKGANLGSLFPSPADQKLVEELIEAVNQSTSKNEKITAYQAIAVKLTAEGAKALKEGFKIGKALVI